MKRTFILLALALLLLGAASKQGRINIRVRDSNGKALAGVSINVLQGEKSVSQGTTDKKGTTIIKNLAPGKYDIKFQKEGFETLVQKDVSVVGDQATPLNVTLKEALVISDSLSESDVFDGKAYSHALQDMGRISPAYDKKEIAYSGRISPAIASPGGAANAYMSPYEAPIEHNTNEFAAIEPNSFQRADTNPLSTFSIDVDTGSYSILRSFLNSNQLPQTNMIRTEELLNYFSYDYPQPEDRHPFAIFTEYGVCPWNTKRGLVHIGLKGRELDLAEAPASNLVFLVDVSGSMEPANKLPLVIQSLSMLADNLREQDRIAIVVYASASGLVLEPSSGADKTKIKDSLSKLRAGGSTAGGAGIQLAYKTAEQHFIKGGNNRIILCTDGDFNVGVSSTASLIELVEDKRKSGVFISVLGYGMGNYKDNRMEQIANKGNGNYAYIDTILEAKKVLVNEMSSTLFTIAKDVKIQVEFNPTAVRAYRLIGYENRMLQTEDFRDDTKDAGELGAGHTVTAIYEIVPAGSDEKIPEVDSLKYQSTYINQEAVHSNEILTVKLRYKLPNGDTSIALDKALANKLIPLDKTSENFRWSCAVTGYSLLLQNSKFKGDAKWEMVKSLAKGAIGKDAYGYRSEFLKLVETAELLQGNSQRKD